jgi:XTP/dITP diphosphohydrolase
MTLSMQTITLVTSSQHKLAEWRQQWPLDIELTSKGLELEEIQSEKNTVQEQLLEIAEHKVRQAYALVGSPVIVEDVAAGLDRLNGFPGPYIKHLIKSLPEEHGHDGLFAIAAESKEAATAHCIAAYYDGKQLITVIGTVKGTVSSPRGERGFGFDFSFIPEGEMRTYAEMSLEEKARTSHRGKAIKLLAEKIAAL